MKIDANIRNRFDRQERVARELKLEVDRDLMKRKDPSWHYESRVKKDESFALKVETGRVHDLEQVEDVFAATIVVPNANQIQDAATLVTDKYDFEQRRPRTDSETTKTPDSFRFDDLRLYVRYRRVEGERTAIPDGTLFEVQIKTFLQHAWSVATHDLVYKSAQRDWRRERIAHQIRASLEQAEVVIGSIESLAGTPVLPESSPEIEDLNRIIAILTEEWEAHSLPRDVRRLAESIRAVLLVINRGHDVDRGEILQRLLTDGRAQAADGHSLDWSPYRAVLNYAARQFPQRFRKRFADRSGVRQRILVYPETLETLGMSKDQAVACVVLDDVASP